MEPETGERCAQDAQFRRTVAELRRQGAIWFNDATLRLMERLIALAEAEQVRREITEATQA